MNMYSKKEQEKKHELKKKKKIEHALAHLGGFSWLLYHTSVKNVNMTLTWYMPFEIIKNVFNLQ